MTDAIAHSRSVLLAYSFRPFFLLTGIYGALAVVAWVGYMFAGWPVPLGFAPSHWHSHELLFGLVPAAIAGFLLTAMSNWTGARPLQGAGLLALVLLWVAGRLAMWSYGVLPPLLIAAIDLAFLPVLASYAGIVLMRHGNWRNMILVGVLGLLAIANLMMHVSLTGYDYMWGRTGEILALNVITVLMVVVAGRIIPAFTRNWLRGQGRPADVVRVRPRLELAVLPVTALMIPADLVTTLPWLGAGVALLAAVLNGWRLWDWGGWHTGREPLLWILHLAYLWIVVALVFKALTPFVAISPTVWIHAMGAGAISTLILGVMTRVAVGHTGRPLALLPLAIFIYVAITLAAVLRMLVALNLLDYQLGLIASGVGWSLAFLGYSVIYWPVLTRPRVDGRPG